MYSKNIDIAPSARAVLPDGCQVREFNLTTRPSLWAFIEALPARVPVGSVQKIYVELGSSDYDARPLRIRGDVGFYSHPTFDFAAYQLATRIEQQRSILDILHSAAVVACNDQRADTTPFDAAYEIVRSQAFPLRELSIDEVLAKLGLE